MKTTSKYTVSIMLLAVLLSLPGTEDKMTWFFETVPVMIGAALLFLTRRKFSPTPLLAILIVIHAIILCVGGHYTYAKVPVGFWVQDWLDLARNNYDRLGHLAQGFVPAILAREILIKNSIVSNKNWMFYIICAICLSFSAFYELIEWWTAVIAGDGATDFLGTQGDVWDAQWDMFLALIGCVVSLLLLSKQHNKQLNS